MNCPRCEGGLDERDRDGVTIDVCPACRGIWLDRGELEKLIARATREADELERSSSPRDRDDREDRGRDRADDDDDDRRRGQGGRRRGWLESLGDIFD